MGIRGKQADTTRHETRIIAICEMFLCHNDSADGIILQFHPFIDCILIFTEINFSDTFPNANFDMTIENYIIRQQNVQ